MPRRDAGGDALLAKIFADPDADEPRLVYADWLIEKGDPRGEFIRLQIADDLSLAQKKNTLLKKHEKAWLAPIREHVRTWRWQRGFVSWVECTAAGFVAGADALLAAAPALDARITTMKKTELPAVAAKPLGKFRGIDLSSKQLGDKDVVKLARARTMKGLRSLSLFANKFAAAGAKALAESADLATLEALSVGRMSPRGLQVEAWQDFAAGAIALVTSKNLANVRALDLSYDGIGPKVAQAIASTTMTKLESLVLGGNPIGDDGAAILAKAKLPNLKSIQLYNCRMGPAGYRAFLDAKNLPALRELDIGFGNEPMSPDLLSAINGRYPEGRRP
jgi:uncharacterized protein (TIGR02996 family)